MLKAPIEGALILQYQCRSQCLPSGIGLAARTVGDYGTLNAVSHRGKVGCVVDHKTGSVVSLCVSCVSVGSLYVQGGVLLQACRCPISARCPREVWELRWGVGT